MSSSRDPHIRSGVLAASGWFLDNGVPNFLEQYHTADRWRQLLPPLIILTAFEVGMATWHAPTLLQLFTAPPLIVAYFGFLWWASTATAPEGRFRRIRFALLYTTSAVVGAALGVALVIYLDRVGIEVWLNNETIDSLTILLLLLASLALTGPGASAASARTARLLVWSLAAAVVLFAAEGTVLPPLFELVQTFTGSGQFLPPALPSLLVVIPLSYACWRIGRGAPGNRTAGGVMIMPAAPLLLILLAAEIATLPHTFLDPWSSVAIVVAAGVLVFFAVRRGGPGYDQAARDEMWLAGAGLYIMILLAVSLLAYPVIVGFYGRLSFTSTSTPVEGWAAFGLAALVHLVYLLVTLVVINFGLDRLAVWGAREARKNVKHLGNGMAEGLPLLLVFITFFMFSGETWQIAYLTSLKAYVGLLALLGLAVVVVLLWTATQRVPPNPRYETSRLQECAASAAKGNPELTALVDGWKSTVAGTAEQQVPLTGRTRLNAVAVFAMYEALVLIPLAVLTAGLLFVICKLTIRPKVAAGWIFGDGQEQRGLMWQDDVLPRPYVQVAVVLAVFALLYVAVEIHRDDSEKSPFFAGAANAVAQRLAVYAAYRWALAVGDESPDVPEAPEPPPEPEPSPEEAAPAEEVRPTEPAADEGSASPVG